MPADRTPSVGQVAGELGAAAGLVLDVTDESAVADAVAAAGAIDVLVTAHGILTRAPFAELPTATWSETLAIDLTSVFLLNRAVLPGMLARGGGRIVNIASQLGIKGRATLAHYAAAKAGVIAMTKSLAIEVRSAGVLANVIAPARSRPPWSTGSPRTGSGPSGPTCHWAASAHPTRSRRLRMRRRARRSRRRSGCRPSAAGGHCRRGRSAGPTLRVRVVPGGWTVATRTGRTHVVRTFADLVAAVSAPAVREQVRSQLVRIAALSTDFPGAADKTVL